MTDRLYVGTRKGLFFYERNGRGEWKIARTAFVGDPVTYVLHDERDGTLYAALNLGHFGVKLHRSFDSGESFHEVAAPAYPKAKDGAKEDAPAVKLLWCLETGGADRPGVLWAGTIPGGLFRSDDRGETWKLNDALWNEPERAKWFGGGYDQPGIHSVIVDPTDSRRVLVAVSCGGVWITEDQGSTWRVSTRGMFAEYMPPEGREDPSIQDPHRMVMCPSAPNVLWVQHHNGVFRSSDGGESWSSITSTPSSFGFAAAIHPRDPKTSWLVPLVKDERRVPVDGKVVLARTRDGGESFEVLREGLPQEHAYDVVYRHGMAVDKTGDRLAMGSTTGSLWLSEDQGDSFRSLSTQLPPVYSVRFV
jgi:BNR/Asp-box repeat